MIGNHIRIEDENVTDYVVGDIKCKYEQSSYCDSAKKVYALPGKFNTGFKIAYT